MPRINQYINMLESLCQSIASAEQRVKALEDSHSNRLASIEKNYRAKAQQLTNKKNDSIRRAKEEQAQRNEVIKNYVAQIDSFEQRIPDRFRKDVVIDNASLTPQDCDWYSMQEMAERILDETLWGKVKGALNVYGYYSHKDMVKDYLIHIAEARELAEQEVLFAKEKLDLAQRDIDQRLKTETQALDEIRKKETDKENNSFTHQLQLEQTALSNASDSSNFSLIAKEIRSGFTELKRNSNHLGSSLLPKNTLQEILFGEIAYELPHGHAFRKSIESELQPFCKFPLVKLPYTVSAKGSYSVLIETSNKHRGIAFDGIRSIMARMILSYPFEGLEISYVDPVDRGTNLERFEKLATSDDCTVIRPPFASEDAIEKELARLEKAVDELSLKLATVGTIDDFNANNSVKLPHRLVVVNDFPSGFNRKALEAFNVLLNNSEKCGLSFIFTHNKEQGCEREAETLYKRIKSDSTIIEEGSRGFLINDKGKKHRFSFISSKKIPMPFFDNVINEYSTGKTVDNSFARICDFKKRIDFEDSTDGLFIPFAVNRYNEVVNLELGTASAAHMVITGSTGSGKSTTLHAIIAGLMLKYHPKDTEIWLVDYKETEFAEYLLNRFPHIKLVGLDKSKEFTYALVDMIYNEKEKRERHFASKHVQDLAAYKRDFGAQSYPRIVIIIDEFHNLAQTIKDDSSYVTKFENILAECRSAGISCVFSDQSIMEGLRGLTEKGKKQLTSRIAMRNSSDEIRGTLDLESSDYTEDLKSKIRALTKGDVVMKRERVSKDGYDVVVEIDKYKSIYVQPEDRKKLVSYISANIQDCLFADPLVVNGQKRLKFSKTAIQEYETKSEAPRSGETYLYLGTPSNFDPCFRILLTKQLGQNVAILGSETNRRMSVILYTIRSFTRNKDCRAVVFAHPEDALYEQYRGLLSKIASPRIQVYDDIVAICDSVNQISQQIADGEKKRILVVLLGYELLCDEFEMLPKKTACEGNRSNVAGSSSAISGIDEMLARFNIDTKDRTVSAQSQAQNDELGYDAREDIGTLVTKGCRYGIHVVLSLEKLNNLRKVKTFKLDSFDHRIALPISPDESLDYFGTSQAAKEVDHISAIYSDSGAPPQVFRPYLLPQQKRK